MSTEVFEKFADLHARHQCIRTGETATDDAPTPVAVADEFDRHARSLGLVVARTRSARRTMFERRDGSMRITDRRTAYVMPLATADGPLESARALAEHIHGLWGAGRVFVLGRAGYLCKREERDGRMPLFGPGHEEDSDAGYRAVVDPTSTERRLRMGVYYAHENQPSEEMPK